MGERSDSTTLTSRRFRRPTAKQAIEMHAHIHKAISRSHNRAAEMVRRGQHPVSDGYPSSSMGANGNGSEVSRPTEAIAIAQADGNTIPDPTGDYIETYFALLNEIVEKAQRLDGISATVLGIEVDERGRQSTIRTCANPNCADALLGEVRRGRCDPCRKYLDKTGMDAPAEMIAKRHELRERRAS